MPNWPIDTSDQPERNKSVIAFFFFFLSPFKAWAVHCLDGSSLRVDCNWGSKIFSLLFFFFPFSATGKALQSTQRIGCWGLLTIKFHLLSIVQDEKYSPSLGECIAWSDPGRYFTLSIWHMQWPDLGIEIQYLHEFPGICYDKDSETLENTTTDFFSLIPGPDKPLLVLEEQSVHNR